LLRCSQCNRLAGLLNLAPGHTLDFFSGKT